MSTALPLFPLATVLFPGLLLPLRVFEPRYRSLVRHLMALPDGVPRQFGVVAIRKGWEVERGAPGASGALTALDSPALYEVGCTAEIRRINEQSDGRFDIVAVGKRRFRVLSLDQDAAPYLTAEVEWMTDSRGPVDRAEFLAGQVLAAFRRYLRLVRAPGGEVPDEQLPNDPTVLSHLVAATTSLPIEERQRLLAEADTVSRLLAELALLGREAALLSRVRAVPVPLAELAVPTAPN